MFGLFKTKSPEDYIRGRFGEAVKNSVGDLLRHFDGLPGWKGQGVYTTEYCGLAGFLALQTLRKRLAKAGLNETQAAEVVVGVVQGLVRMFLTRDADVTERDIHEAQSDALGRVKEYDEIWEECQRAKSSEHFYFHAFQNVWAGDGHPSDGFIDHCMSFGKVLQRIDEDFRMAI